MICAICGEFHRAIKPDKIVSGGMAYLLDASSIQHPAAKILLFLNPASGIA